METAASSVLPLFTFATSARRRRLSVVAAFVDVSRGTVPKLPIEI